MTSVIGALIRLITESPLLIPIISNTSFSEGLDTPKNQLAYWPIEIERKQLVVSQNKNATLQDEILSWVRNNWQSAIKLMVKYPEFMVAIEAFDKARFAPSYPLGLLQLWSALESIFSPDRGELRFRVSALIATFLESAGENRLKEQRKIARLYDARSAAAHGRAEDAETPFMESYALFRKILMRMIEMKTVPKSDDLRQMLLQGSSYID